MSSEITVRADNLSKCYQIYNKSHDRLLQTLFRGKRKYYKEFWALKNITFQVRKGETLGIVGRNGSGKTTLLQLISGILTPTEGNCEINGRVAALLALGAGFNPEFTGRENIYLNASMLGFTDKEIKKKYKNICEFAEIGEFIDQPVKKYSSGMYMRLAFSISVHVDPEILIIDEALAVGDEAFQRKCYARLEKLKKQGMTLLFVSHSANAVVSLCDRALLIERGELIANGEPKSIISSYHKLLFTPPQKSVQIIHEIKNSFANTVKSSIDDVIAKTGSQKCTAHYIHEMQPKSTFSYESKGAQISELSLTTLDGTKVNVLCNGEEYIYNYKVVFLEDSYRVRFGMMVKNISGIEIGGFATSSKKSSIEEINSGETMLVQFTFMCRLNAGVYFLNAGVRGVIDEEETFLHRIVDALMIRVLPEEDQRFTGLVDFGTKAQVISTNE